MLSKLLVLITLFCFSHLASADALDNLIQNSKWDDAVQTSFEITKKNPNNHDARLKGAYALFQKGYFNSALVYLKSIPMAEWKKLPQGKDKLVEVVLLFQKKMPAQFIPWRLDQLPTDISSNVTADELNYAKARLAFESGNDALAEKLFLQINSGSRYYAASLYLLGSIKVKQTDYAQAHFYFSKVFEPVVFEKSTEFWKDVSSEMTSHWGANLKIQFTADPLLQIKRIGELSMLGLARLAYAQKKFDLALERYSKVPSSSKYYNRANIEKVWALLSMAKHQEAEALASKLEFESAGVESMEAKILKALIMADAGMSEKARSEINEFQKKYLESKKDITPFLNLKNDQRIQALEESQKNIKSEIEDLKKEELRIYSAYKKFASDLEALKFQSANLIARWNKEKAVNARADLDKFYLQSKLIKAETYLEEHHKLKLEFKKTGAGIDLKKQSEYEARLADLLEKASEQVGGMDQSLNLKFRQSEIIWELGTTKIILGQENEGEKLREQATKIIEGIANQKFNKQDQALFFLGFAYMETGRTNESMQVFRDYVKRFPQHVHVPDAYRILGDQNFDENKFVQAENDYKQVLQFADSPFVGYALYKLGWSGYNLRAYGRALLGLEEAYLWTKKSAQTGGELLSLQREARRDLISVYAELGDHKKAFEYFKNIDQDYLPWILELVKQLEQNGQYEKTQDLYAQLIQADPKSKNAMLYQAGIIYSAYRLQRWQIVETTLFDLLNNYSDQLKNPTKEETTEAKVEAIIREAVTAHLNDFKASVLDAVKERIVKLNSTYLGAFEKWPQSQNLLYRHAQYLFENNNIKAAQNCFENHWLWFKNEIKDPLKEEALRNLISTLGRLEDLNKDSITKLTSEAEKIINFTTEYEKLYPETKYTRTILFLKASIFLKFKKLEEGIKISQQLLDDKADDDITKKSFKNLAKAYYELRDWERTYNWALKTKGPKNELQIIKEESYFLWAQGITDPKKASELYLKIAQNPDMAKLHDKSLYNAFIYFEKLNDYSKAIEVAEKLEKKNPNYDGFFNISGVRASMYQESGQYDKALQQLNLFLKKPGDEKLQKQAQLNRALILEALEQTAQAQSEFKNYLNSKSGATEAGKKEAELALKRLTYVTKKEVIPKLPEWEKLKSEKATYDKQLSTKSKDFVKKIKEDGIRLQNISKKFLDISGNEKINYFHRYEALCVVPFLYSKYAFAIRLIKGDDAELDKELEKLAQPIDQKSKEFAQSCIDQSYKARHRGPEFEKVLDFYGWQADANMASKANDVLKEFEKKYPLIQKSQNSKEEELTSKILKLNGEKKSDKDSWYNLAYIRYTQKKYRLARLTTIDALSKFQKSYELFNLFVAIELKLNTEDNILDLFEDAGEKGSGHGWANAGYLHLKDLRLQDALKNFKLALNKGAFDEEPELKDKIRELLK
ncbi:MAG: tetratricopeptide repeat protein [Oligoflexia bacterium]|nr:tetratricopeptide repeat protein [Oligoflexia bacterium]